MNPAAGTLKLEIGVPHVVSVTHPRGLPVKSRFSGDQMMWTLGDGRKLYADLYVQERIDALHLAPMTPFEIERVETFAGNRRSIEVVVRPAGTPPRPPAPPVGPTPPAATPPPPAPPAPAPVNGQGQTAADIYRESFRAAIAATIWGIEEAKAAGLTLAPDFEDVRALAIHLNITRCGR